MYTEYTLNEQITYTEFNTTTYPVVVLLLVVEFGETRGVRKTSRGHTRDVQAQALQLSRTLVVHSGVPW